MIYKKKYAKDGVKNPYESIFDQVSKEKGVPKEILTALAGGESTFNRDSIGPMTKSGQAVGIMQLMPATIKSLGITDPNDPYQNISGGAQWLKDAYKRTGNWKDAVGEYNSGPDTWRKNKEGVMKQSPKYYKDIYAAIDSISGTQKPLSIPKFTPAVADKTSVARVPGKDNLFPIQRSTLASINKQLPQVKNEGIRPATEGYETEQADISQWMSLYDDPELATNVDFISNLFNHK